MSEAKNMIDEIIRVIPYLYEFLLYIKIAKTSIIILKVIATMFGRYIIRYDNNSRPIWFSNSFPLILNVFKFNDQ